MENRATKESNDRYRPSPRPTAPADCRSHGGTVLEQRAAAVDLQPAHARVSRRERRRRRMLPLLARRVPGHDGAATASTGGKGRAPRWGAEVAACLQA